MKDERGEMKDATVAFLTLSLTMALSKSLR